jgi:cell division initiation protein
MKVLVDKVEDYRSNEDAIRLAVLSAQRLGGTIEQEARDKAAAILADAQAAADNLTRDSRMELETEQARLTEAKERSARFVENMELLCNRQLSFLQKIGEMDFLRERRAAQAAAPVPEEDPAVSPEEESNEIHETVKSIEETVAKVAAEPVSTVRPDFSAAAAIDDLPTQAYKFVTDADDDLEKTAQFSFEGFEK